MKTTERILKYLDGELNNNELKQFEAELLINPEFAEIVDLHKGIEDTLKDKDLIIFRKRLDKVYKSNYIDYTFYLSFLFNPILF